MDGVSGYAEEARLASDADRNCCTVRLVGGIDGKYRQMRLAVFGKDAGG